MKLILIKIGLTLGSLFFVDQGLKSLATPVPVLPAHYQWAEINPGLTPFLLKSFSIGTSLDQWSDDQWQRPEIECSETCEITTPILNL